MSLHFSKTLAKFYQKWYDDAIKSVEYCNERGWPDRAEDYRHDAEQFKKIIDENKEAIEFFSVNDNAHKIERALPEKFRGYK